ncbi:MAG TPA: ABC transporter permease [Candidatus Stackebrandtia excrementipullorum]|nr:ABC transporter permease [Candidatus Stackebrandtia excrementipullorum]
MRMLREALRDLRANKGRSVLAGISLLVSLLGLVAVACVGTVIKDGFIVEYEQRHGRLPVLESTVDFGTLTTDRVDELVKHFDRHITATGGVWTLRSDRYSRIATVGDDGTADAPTDITATLIAGDPSSIRRLPLLSGSWPDLSRLYPGGLVLNRAAADLYGSVGSGLVLQHDDPGDDPRQRPYMQSVVGVISDGDDAPHVYQSLISAAGFQPSILEQVRLTLSVHHPGANTTLLHQHIADVLTTVSADEAPQINAPADISFTLNNLTQMQVGFAAVSAVTLVVAIIGLLNIGLATLRERIRELSLRRAVGATRLRVFGLVMSSTLILSMSVAAVTLATAWLGVQWMIPYLLDPASALDPPGFPVEAAWYGIAAALFAGVLGGLVPAFAASRVDMVAVLRE